MFPHPRLLWEVLFFTISNVHEFIKLKMHCHVLTPALQSWHYFQKTGPIRLNATKHVPYSLAQIYFAWPYMNCLDKSLFSSTFVILKCRCIWVIFPFCFLSLRSTASKTKCQHAVDWWLNSWRDTEELPCQSPQGLGRPSVPRQGSLGSKRALNLVILEANGRYQRLYINQGGTWRKTSCWSKCQAEGN